MKGGRIHTLCRQSMDPTTAGTRMYRMMSYLGKPALNLCLCARACVDLRAHVWDKKMREKLTLKYMCVCVKHEMACLDGYLRVESSVKIASLSDL